MHKVTDMKLRGENNQHKRVGRASPAILGEVMTGEEHEQTYCIAKNAPYLDLSGDYTGLYVYDNALLHIKICVLHSMQLNIIKQQQPYTSKFKTT